MTDPDRFAATDVAHVIGPALHAAQEKTCRHAGFCRYLFQNPDVHDKLDTSVAGPALKHMLEATIDLAPVIVVRTLEKGGCVPRALDHLQRTVGEWPDVFGQPAHGKESFRKGVRVLKADYDRFFASEVFRNLKLYRTEVVAHDLWRNGSETRRGMEKNGTLPGRRATYSDLSDALETTAQLCADAIALLGYSPECPDALINGHSEDAARFWAALPEFAEVEENH